MITLGVIGVVAAITIPGLITKYRRSVVEGKLKKFYSTINQAVRLSIYENEDIPYMETSGTTGQEYGDKILTWYTTYILKYMQGLTADKVQGSNSYIKASFNDGSGFVSYMADTASNQLWIFYCLDAYDKSCAPESFDGKNTFLFIYNPKTKSFETGWNGASRSNCKASCYSSIKGNRHGCSELIKQNGWKIPNDYKWIK